MEMTRRTTYEWEVEWDGSPADSLKGQSKGEKKKIYRQVSTSKIEQKNKNNNTYELEAGFCSVIDGSSADSLKGQSKGEKKN